MISRSGFSLAGRHVHAAFGAACLALLGIGACNNPTGLELTAEAIASCPSEDPTPAMTAAGPTMLPGRVCGACHRSGGQAQNSPWTLSGTLYADGADKCNTPGLAGAKIEVLYTENDPMGRYRMNDVQIGGTLTTNEVGNFNTAAQFVSPMKIRVYTGDTTNPTKERFMGTLVGRDPNTNQSIRVDCNFCHYSGGLAGSRIYLK
jgi:hypothetical protein